MTFPATYCGFCHGNTSTGCEYCNPAVHGKIDFLEPTPADIHKELEELRKRIEKLEHDFEFLTVYTP